MSASSSLTDYAPKSALFTKSSSWSPIDDDKWPYLQVDIAEIIILIAVATKGGMLRGEEHWVKSFQLWYGFSGTNWRLYKEGFLNKV